MDYTYVAYTEDRRLIKGKVAATTDEAAANLLAYGGYQVVSLKKVTPFLNTEKLAAAFSRVQPREIVMFSRQLALLLESGTDIVGALELLQAQTTNRTLRRTLGEVANDIRGGSSLSVALGKHPRCFSVMYGRAIAAGEQGGNLEVVLRQMADYIERAVITEKKIKSALTYPIIVAVVALIVIAVLVTFVLPTFTNLYATFAVKMPLPTRILMNIASWSARFGVYVLAGLLVGVGLGYAYIKTPAGRQQWDALMLRLPVMGRINLLGELSRCCRTMSLLFKVRLPLPEIMNMVVQGSSNRVVADCLKEIQAERTLP